MATLSTSDVYWIFVNLLHFFFLLALRDATHRCPSPIPSHWNEATKKTLSPRSTALVATREAEEEKRRNGKCGRFYRAYTCISRPFIRFWRHCTLPQYPISYYTQISVFKNALGTGLDLSFESSNSFLDYCATILRVCALICGVLSASLLGIFYVNLVLKYMMTYYVVSLGLIIYLPWVLKMAVYILVRLYESNIRLMWWNMCDVYRLKAALYWRLFNGLFSLIFALITTKEDGYELGDISFVQRWLQNLTVIGITWSIWYLVLVLLSSAWSVYVKRKYYPHHHPWVKILHIPIKWNSSLNVLQNLYTLFLSVGGAATFALGCVLKLNVLIMAGLVLLFAYIQLVFGAMSATRIFELFSGRNYNLFKILKGRQEARRTLARVSLELLHLPKNYWGRTEGKVKVKCCGHVFEEWRAQIKDEYERSRASSAGTRSDQGLDGANPISPVAQAEKEIEMAGERTGSVETEEMDGGDKKDHKKQSEKETNDKTKDNEETNKEKEKENPEDQGDENKIEAGLFLETVTGLTQTLRVESADIYEQIFNDVDDYQDLPTVTVPSHYLWKLASAYDTFLFHNNVVDCWSTVIHYGVDLIITLVLVVFVLLSMLGFVVLSNFSENSAGYRQSVYVNSEGDNVTPQYPICTMSYAGALSTIDLMFLTEVPYHFDTYELFMKQFDRYYSGNNVWDTVYYQLDEPIYYYLKHKTQPLDIVGIRGTKSFEDLMQDMSLFSEVVTMEVFSWVLPIRTVLPLASLRDAVYYSSFSDVLIDEKVRERLYYSDILHKIEDIAANSTDINNRTLIVLGHSLGGTLAQIIASKLYDRADVGYKEVFAFGLNSPGLAYGSRKFGIEVEALARTAISVISGRDLISKIDTHEGLIETVECRRDYDLQCHIQSSIYCELYTSCIDLLGSDPLSDCFCNTTRNVLWTECLV